MSSNERHLDCIRAVPVLLCTGSMTVKYGEVAILSRCIICALSQVDGGLGWVWSCLTIFYAARVAQHVLHVWLHWQTSAFGLYLRGPASEAGKAGSGETAPLLGPKSSAGTSGIC